MFRTALPHADMQQTIRLQGQRSVEEAHHSPGAMTPMQAPHKCLPPHLLLLLRDDEREVPRGKGGDCIILHAGRKAPREVCPDTGTDIHPTRPHPSHPQVEELHQHGYTHFHTFIAHPQVEELRQHGYVVIDGFIPPELAEQVNAATLHQHARGRMVDAPWTAAGDARSRGGVGGFDFVMPLVMGRPPADSSPMATLLVALQVWREGRGGGGVFRACNSREDTCGNFALVDHKMMQGQDWRRAGETT